MPRSVAESTRARVDAEAPELVRAFAEQLRRRPALKGISLLAAPVTLPVAARAFIARQCELVRSALLRVATAARWNLELPMPEGLARLVDSESLALPRLDACRLDAFCDADGGALQFLEIQAGDPSGLGMADAALGCMRSLGAPAPYFFEARRQQVLRQWRGPGLPRVAVVNEDASFVLSDTELMAEALRANGHQAQRVDARRFTFEGGRLEAEGAQYDVILRDSHEELGPATEGLNRALEAGLPRFNPLRDVWFDDKGCFAMLWEQLGALPADEREAVERHVPQTVRVTDASRARLVSDRPGWVLKPAQGYGGFGVVIGRDVDDATWSTALVSPRRMVAQRYVEVPRQPVARVVGEGVEWREQYVTLSFWLHQGRFSVAYARAGERRVVNVHQGGGLGPLIFEG